MPSADSGLRGITVSVPWVHRIACIVATATFLLIVVGGLVTSKGAGMSVPDWPTTYGYNMFLFPYSKWVGGIFWEHSHRLIASGVGLLTIILAGATFFKDRRTWVRWLAVVAVIAVSAQGVLGGLRVTLYKDQIGIFHTALAQSFFGLLLILIAITGKRFLSGAWFADRAAASLRWLVLAGLLLTYFQIGVAATIRHQHAPLAIRDFPAAYGQFLPATDPAALKAINAGRQADKIAPVTAGQIHLQLAHRAGAVVLLFVVIATAILSVAQTPLGHWLRAWSLLWVGAILLQILLGGITIWSNKAADVATAHMALGALLTGFAILFTFRLFCAASDSTSKETLA
ncbi:MAG: COX15/CtaA family protein [Verrucomicrobia bacterium]|nr:COX15/CtaA family protein [Verrucomicrobiota bacterium]